MKKGDTPLSSAIDAQKEYLETILNLIKSPIYTTRNILTIGKDGKQYYHPGKQIPIGGMFPPVDHRSIGENEIIIELDAQSFAQNAKYAKQITAALEAQEIPYYTFWSGNKSIHTHIFLEDPDLKDPKNITLILKAIDSGWKMWKDIRLSLTKQIIEAAGLNPNIIGVGKTVDLAKLSWNNDEGTRTPLIRCCGGSNKKIDPITGDATGGYKSYLPGIPDKKPTTPTQFEDVVYPKNILPYILPEQFVAELAEAFLAKDIPKEAIAIPYKGKYLSLPCSQKILEGLPQGKRSFGAQQLAVACRLDGLSQTDAEPVLKAYVKACSHSAADPFTDAEALDWLKWTYKVNKPYWACGVCVRLDCCFRLDCSYNQEKYKKEIEIFDVDEPLKVIKDALDLLIVGEDSLKMQLFLLYLTKDIGKHPECFIVLDGPAASGKTHVMKGVASLFGEERQDWFGFSRLTGKILDNLGDMAQTWKNKIVIIEELQGAHEASEQLRVAISEGVLNLIRTREVLGPDGTKTFAPEEIRTDLDCLFVTCNAENADEGDQLQSRAWILNTDTTKSQTSRIVKHYLSNFKGAERKTVPNLELIRSGLKFLDRDMTIIFPFSEELEEFIPVDSVRARRDVKKIILAIRACAYFHQRNRIKVTAPNGDRFLLADWRDVYFVFKYAGQAFNASTQGLGAKDLEYFQIISRIAVKYSEFGVDDVVQWCGISTANARKVMSNLCNAGLYENKAKPPLPAEYSRTSWVPKSFDETYTLHKIEGKMADQQSGLDLARNSILALGSSKPM